MPIETALDLFMGLPPPRGQERYSWERLDQTKVEGALKQKLPDTPEGRATKETLENHPHQVAQEIQA